MLKRRRLWNPLAYATSVTERSVSASKRFANHLLHARRSGRAHDDFAAMLFAQTQTLFERIRVRLIHLVGDILLADPRAIVVQAGLPFTRRDLLDSDGDLHGVTAPIWQQATESRRLGAAEYPRVLRASVSPWLVARPRIS